MVERGFARDPVTPWNLKDRPAALGSKRIGLDLRWSRLAPLCCWPGLPSEFETDFANALGALCGISGRGFRCSSHVSSWHFSEVVVPMCDVRSWEKTGSGQRGMNRRD